MEIGDTPSGTSSKVAGVAARAAGRARARFSRRRHEDDVPRPVAPAAEPAHHPLRMAAVTVARDEAAMLPVWIRHYGDQLGVENLYVFDDNSVDGSTDQLPCDVIRIPPVRDGKFESTRMRLVSGFADSLLAVYDAVLFCDVDEFVVADPAEYDGLKHFAETHRHLESVGVVALDVIHNVGVEGPLDLTRPILGQRTLASFAPLMCKPSLTFTASRWVAASHGTTVPYRVDPGLWMFHMKFADRDHLATVAEHRKQMVELDGRSGRTQWKGGKERLVGRLDTAAAAITLPEVEDFQAPGPEDLEALVFQNRAGQYRAPKGRQSMARKEHKVVRIPSRFHGLV